MLSATLGQSSASLALESARLLSSADEPQQTTERCRALTALVLAEKSYFQRTANSILHNESDAEDAVHSAFCSAWKAMAHFRGEASLKTWFTRIVANAALSVLRSRRNRRTIFLEDNPECMNAFELNSSADVENPEQIIARKERLQQVAQHMDSLPSETRAVLLLHFGDDCSIETIARMRGKSRPAIAAHLHRGKALLKRKVRLTSTGRRLRKAELQ
jgi:RNA polymerase sigma-70 factor (ECF subfamily)